MLFAPSGKGRKRQKKGEKGRFRPISRKGGQTPLKPPFVTPPFVTPPFAAAQLSSLPLNFPTFSESVASIHLLPESRHFLRGGNREGYTTLVRQESAHTCITEMTHMPCKHIVLTKWGFYEFDFYLGWTICL